MENKRKCDNAPRFAIWMQFVPIGWELGIEGVVLSLMILYVASRGVLQQPHVAHIRMHKMYRERERETSVYMEEGMFPRYLFVYLKHDKPHGTKTHLWFYLSAM